MFVPLCAFVYVVPSAWNDFSLLVYMLTPEHLCRCHLSVTFSLESFLILLSSVVPFSSGSQHFTHPSIMALTLCVGVIGSTFLLPLTWAPVQHHGQALLG